VRYRYSGHPRKVTLDRLNGASSLATVHKRAQLVLDRVADGYDPAQEKRAAKQRTRGGESDLFADVARLFIKRYAKPKNRSWIESARLLGLRPDPKDTDKLIVLSGSLTDSWARRRTQDIKKSDVLEVLDGIMDRGAGTLANRTLAAVRKMFNWCVEREIIETSPCKGISDPAPKRERERVLSDDEIRWLWFACDKSGFPFGPAVKVLLLTGQRESEVGGMRRAEINLAFHNWTILGSRTKSGKPHDVPLSDAVISLLQKLPRIKSDAGYYFTTNGERPVSGWSRAKARLDRDMLAEARKTDPQAEIPDWVLHDIRRTVASGMARLSIDLPVIEKVLNHSSGTFRGIVRVYQRHDFAQEKSRALEDWARFVLSLVQERPADDVARPSVSEAAT